MSTAHFEEIGIDERRSSILEMLRSEGKVKVTDLSRAFSISEVTIRNDLSELEQAGMLTRVHGGAVGTQKAYFNMSLNDRMIVNQDEKLRIAKAVKLMINEGDTLMLDSGTTTYFVAREIADIKNLTIVTNSLQVAQELSYQSNINVILLGGSLDPRYQYTYGDDALNQLKKYKADKMITAVDGVSAKSGLTTYHYLEAEVSRQMSTRANRTIAVADYTKIAREGFAHINAITSIDTLVTNKEADKEEIKAISSLDIEVLQV
jgi:DeoR/GlpR family transcriptional regulator of sugar metabolism